VDAEVLERDEQAEIERVPQAELGGDPAVEPAEDRPAVGALGRRGEPEEHVRPEVLEQPAVGRRLRVVELVHDHDVVGVGPEALQPFVV
jgi:hypothetical protein